MDQVISGSDEILRMKVSDMPGYSYLCKCGREHSVDIKKIVTGTGVLNSLPDIIEDFRNSEILIVCDKNTNEVAGKRVEQMLKAAGFDINSVILETENYPALVPNEASLGSLMINISDKTGLVIAVGSGTLNDICKIVTYKMKLPSIIVGTAPSMDGYASTMSPLIINKHKITYPSHYPYAIINDSEIMQNAPHSMFTAGFGDVVGKYTALSDWRLTVAVNGEYYCETTAKLMQNAVDLCVSNMQEYINRKQEAITIMNEALILAGITMGLVGITRPASGSEHHLSHFWELALLEKGLEHPLHGNSVGLASIISAEVYAIMSERFEVVHNINAPKPDFLRELYIKAGAAISPRQLGISRELLKESLLNGYRIRPRYTIFNYTKDHGMLPEIAEIVTAKMCES